MLATFLRLDVATILVKDKGVHFALVVFYELDLGVDDSSFRATSKAL
jgi:hypothetical protein